MVLLRIAASGGGAAMNDAIRAVSVLVETKWIDRLSEDIHDEVAMLVEAVAEETDMTKESGDYGPSDPVEGAVPCSYAVAVGVRPQALTRECSVVFAKAAQHETEIMVTRAPEVTAHGLAQLSER
ncbi:hypothetical protein C8J57DRAFT_1537861 [Mycena rebaudengoi]|nr:hypothetical protein C8J57DRAFT_1537861 [Mycena rebaudengoi]